MLPTVDPAEYVVQAVDEAGNVGMDDSDGLYYQALLGDVDDNCVVNISDIMSVANWWRCKCGDPCYAPRYDLNGDCDIDIVDIMLAVARWGEVCSP